MVTCYKNRRPFCILSSKAVYLAPLYLIPSLVYMSPGVSLFVIAISFLTYIYCRPYTYRCPSSYIVSPPPSPMSPRFKYCCPFSYILYAFTYYPQLLYLSSPLYILTSFIVYNDASIHIVALIVYNVPLYNSTSFLVYNAPLYNWTSFLVYIVAPNRPCISSLVKEQGIGVLYEVIKYGRGDHFQ